MGIAYLFCDSEFRGNGRDGGEELEVDNAFDEIAELAGAAASTDVVDAPPRVETPKGLRAC